MKSFQKFKFITKIKKNFFNFYNNFILNVFPKPLCFQHINNEKVENLKRSDIIPQDLTIQDHLYILGNIDFNKIFNKFSYTKNYSSYDIKNQKE